MIARGHQHLSMPEFLSGDVVEVQNAYKTPWKK